MIEVRVDDLAFYEGEAIARPVTAEFAAPTALLRRLETAAGTELARQLQRAEALPVGSAIVTGAGSLGVELLVHAVVMSHTEPVSASSVRRATTSALQRASDWGIARLAFTPFGLGAGNLDVEESAAVMVDVMHRHLASGRGPTELVIVVENDEERRAFEFQAARHRAGANGEGAR